MITLPGPTPSFEGATGRSLTRRAAACLPSLTHLSTASLRAAFVTNDLPAGAYSQWMESGEGCVVRDVDGKAFIDYMGSFGPSLLGHKHPCVEAAIAEQRSRGDCLAGPTARMVELAEALTSPPYLDWSSWAFFAKNGSDATVVAVRVARAATGRRTILRAPRSYHGAASIWREGTPEELLREGVLAGEAAHLAPYRYNDLASVERAADAAGDDFAGIIVAAFRWDYGRPQEIATAAFLTGVRRLCDERGAALICDDVRVGGGRE